MVDLKKFLGLTMPKKILLRCHKVNAKFFGGDFLGLEISNVHDPYIQYCSTV